MSENDIFSHYTFGSTTQTLGYSSRDGKVKIKLFGTKNDSVVYITLNANGDDDWQARDGQEIGRISTNEDLGDIYKISLVAGDGDKWRPAQFIVWRVNSEKKYTSKSVFENPDNKLIGSAPVDFSIDLISSIDLLSDGGGSTTPPVLSPWVVKDYRGKQDDLIQITMSTTESLIEETITRAETNIETETGIKVVNSTNISSANFFGSGISSTFTTEFSTNLKKRMESEKILTNRSEISTSTTVSYDTKGHRVIFFRFTFHPFYSTHKINLFDGSSINIVTPKYDSWTRLDTTPDIWRDITKDEDMTDELKAAFEASLGKWHSIAY